MINPKNILPFLIDQKINKEKIQLQLTKSDGTSPEDDRDKIASFAILSSEKKNKYIGQKRMRDKKNH